MNYYLSSSDHVTGPYEKEELIDSIKYGMTSPDSLVCEEGSDDWLPISVLTEKKTEIANQGPPTVPSTKNEIPFSQVIADSGQPITVHNNYYHTKSPGTAVILEILPGFFCQTFGIGNLYAGNIATGLILMLSYWALCIVNTLLIFVLIGFITWPLTFIAYLIFGIISAQKAAIRSQYHLR